jgi:hypothetical protein
LKRAVAEQDHWTERGRALPVGDSDALGRPHLSVPALGGSINAPTINMVAAFKAVLNGCLWALIGFCVCSLVGLLLVPLGLIDHFVRGEVGQEMETTRLGLITYGFFVATGFLCGIHLEYRPLLRRHPGSKQTPHMVAPPNGGAVRQRLGGRARSKSNGNG